MKLSRVTLTEQPAERGSLLERNVLMFAGLVQRITSRLSVTGPSELVEHVVAIAKDERVAWEWLSNAHLLTIGIRQIERHLQHLKDTGFRTRQIEQAATQFFDAYDIADVKNLRDLLEHQADYVAGKCQKPHLVVDLTESVSFGNDAFGRWVSVFGTRCHVDPILRAVAALDVALREPKGGGR